MNRKFIVNVDFAISAKSEDEAWEVAKYLMQFFPPLARPTIADVSSATTEEIAFLQTWNKLREGGH